jgi:hypothetical protein
MRSLGDWALAISRPPSSDSWTSLLAERGLTVPAIWHLLAREGITFKKSLHAGEQDLPDVARRRLRWRRHQGKPDPTRLVFIDET